MGNQRRSIPLPLTQGAETYLLCQQGIGRRRNQIFKNGANSFSPSQRCPKAPALFSSPPRDRVNRSTPSQHSAQARFNGRMLAMGH
ncbi:hypothetical protein CK203_065309 [Vitis vinifera]|uniref:Uncharacterized protein n=1 Tax=Vitis vinifera TaxID=29760 RepID=A0A438FNN0_VITVI|nr:hypothetical protein CK203_065309 [Vitis vinifera]